MMSEKTIISHQSYDLRNLDKHTQSLIVNNEMDKILASKLCSICQGDFIGQNEKDDAVCSGKNPFTVAHGYCWDSSDIQNQWGWVNEE